jgi:hypothetical protein
MDQDERDKFDIDLIIPLPHQAVSEESEKLIQQAEMEMFNQFAKQHG